MAVIRVIVNGEKKGELHVQWTLDAKEELSEGKGADAVQTKEEINVNNAWDSGSCMFFMELVLTDTELPVSMEVGGNLILLVSKVWDILENLSIRKGAEVLRAPAIVELLERQISDIVFSGITVDVDSKHFNGLGFVVLEAK